MIKKHVVGVVAEVSEEIVVVEFRASDDGELRKVYLDRKGFQKGDKVTVDLSAIANAVKPERKHPPVTLGPGSNPKWPTKKELLDKKRNRI